MRGRGRRILLGGLALVAALYLTLVARTVTGFGKLVADVFGGGRQRDGCADCVGTRPEAGVVRGERAVAWIRRMAPRRPPERPLPLYLADGSDPALDSARAGLLVAVTDSVSGSGLGPVLELVPRDSASGLPLVGRLLTPGGRATIPVYQMGQ